MNQHRFTILFEPAEEGGYTATCPSLPGLVTEGDTLDEARTMAVDAIRGYLEALAKDGLPVPIEGEKVCSDPDVITETVAVVIEDA